MRKVSLPVNLNRATRLALVVCLVLSSCGGGDGASVAPQPGQASETNPGDSQMGKKDDGQSANNSQQRLSESDLGTACDTDGETASIPNGTGVCAADASGNLVWQKMGGKQGPAADEPDYFSWNWDITTTKARAPKCASSTPLSVLPTSVDQIRYTNPLGYSQPGAHALPVPHHNVYVAEQKSVDENGIERRSALVDPIKAPSNATLVGLARNRYAAKTTSGGSSTYDEYMISLHICDTYYLVFNHVDDIPQAWLEAVKDPSVREECNRGQDGAEVCMWSFLEIPVTAGERLGRASGRSHGWDIGATDTSKPMEHRIDPGAYSPRWAMAICALDLFEPALREQLYSTLVSKGECGRPDHDYPTTLSGVWLAVGQRERSAQEDLHIALFPRFTYDGRLRFSIGTETNVAGLPSGIYEFTPEKSGLRNPAFTAVKPGEVACFDDLRAPETGLKIPVTRIYATMQSSDGMETISIAGAGTGKCGNGPYVMPNDQTKFERRLS